MSRLKYTCSKKSSTFKKTNLRLKIAQLQEYSKIHIRKGFFFILDDLMKQNAIKTNKATKYPLLGFVNTPVGVLN